MYIEWNDIKYRFIFTIDVDRTIDPSIDYRTQCIALPVLAVLIMNSFCEIVEHELLALPEQRSSTPPPPPPPPPPDFSGVRVTRSSV